MVTLARMATNMETKPTKEVTNPEQSPSQPVDSTGSQPGAPKDAAAGGTPDPNPGRDHPPPEGKPTPPAARPGNAVEDDQTAETIDFTGDGTEHDHAARSDDPVASTAVHHGYTGDYYATAGAAYSQVTTVEHLTPGAQNPSQVGSVGGQQGLSWLGLAAQRLWQRGLVLARGSLDQMARSRGIDTQVSPGRAPRFMKLLRVLGLASRGVPRPVVGVGAYVRWWERLFAACGLVVLMVIISLVLAFAIGLGVVVAGLLLEQAIA